MDDEGFRRYSETVTRTIQGTYEEIEGMRRDLYALEEITRKDAQESLKRDLALAVMLLLLSVLVLVTVIALGSRA